MRSKSTKVPSANVSSASGLSFRLLGGALLICLASRAGADPLFQAPYLWYESTYGTGSVAVGDLNYDGLDDVVVGRFLAIGVLLGRADQTLAPEVEFSGGGAGVSVAISELTGDGRLDIVAANEYANSVSIFVGNGDGTFHSPVDYPTGHVAAEVASADLDADGLGDLIVSSADYPYVISVLRNLGSTFAPPQDYASFCNPSSLTIADLDGDGLLDVVAANPCGPGKISFWRGLGSGILGPRTDLPVGDFPSAVRVADMNGDVRPDLVVVDGFGNPPQLLVMLNNGSGGFNNPIGTTVDFPSQWLALADFDSDGHVDAAVVHQVSSPPPASWISIFRGNGDGTFAPPTEQLTAPSPVAIAVGRFGPDQHPDVVTVHSSFVTSGVGLMLGNGDATFGSNLRFTTTPEPSSMATEDINGDGHADLVAAGAPLSVMLGNGHGSFGQPVSYPSNSWLYSVAAGALDNDGHSDVAAVSLIENLVSVYHGATGGILAPKVDYPVGINPTFVAIADVNQDGRNDLVCVNGGSGTVSVLLADGGGSFGPKVDSPVGSFPQKAAVGDLNHDGLMDVITGNFGANTVSVLLGHGDGTFAPHHDYPAGPGAFGVALGDLNEDGHLDIAATNYASNTVSVLTGIGDGSFGAPALLPAGSGARDVVISDLDGDHHLDLAVANPLPSTVTVLRGNGNGTYEAAENYGVGDNPVTVALADFNEDGKPDLATPSYSTNEFWVLLNQRRSVPIALLDIDPNVINLANPAPWVTASIEPTNFEPAKIDVSTLRMAGSVPVLNKFVVIGDHDQNGIPDLMVRFAREALNPILVPGTNQLEVTGVLSTGETFRCADGVRVISAGKPLHASLVPNPLNPAGVLHFYTSKTGPVTIVVFDSQGRLVRTLLSRRVLTDGDHAVPVDGRGSQGESLASGIYFYRVETPDGSMVGRLAMVK